MILASGARSREFNLATPKNYFVFESNWAVWWAERDGQTGGLRFRLKWIELGKRTGLRGGAQLVSDRLVGYRPDTCPDKPSQPSPCPCILGQTPSGLTEPPQFAALGTEGNSDRGGRGEHKSN